MANAVRKNFVSADITAYDAKVNHLNTVDDVVSYVLENDSCPEEGETFLLEDELAKGKADFSMNDCAEVQFFSSPAGRVMHVSFTCLEYFTVDEDGDFEDGSDYDDFATFSEEDAEKITNFVANGRE